VSLCAGDRHASVAMAANTTKRSLSRGQPVRQAPHAG
jgi:hypothetical protein